MATVEAEEELEAEVTLAVTVATGQQVADRLNPVSREDQPVTEMMQVTEATGRMPVMQAMAATAEPEAREVRLKVEVCTSRTARPRSINPHLILIPRSVSMVQTGATAAQAALARSVAMEFPAALVDRVPTAVKVETAVVVEVAARAEMAAKAEMAAMAAAAWAEASISPTALSASHKALSRTQ